MEYISIPAIVVICYLVGELFKHCILKKKSKYKLLPVIVGITGGIVGLITFFISPELMFNVSSPILAISIGIVSGLASTGSNEAVKKLLKNQGDEDDEG